MKKLFLFVVILFCFTNTNAIYTPPQKNTVYYDNLVLQLIQANAPLDVNIHPDEGKPFPIDTQFNENNPLPVTISLDMDNASNLMENFNEMLQEDIAPQLKETWQTLVGTFLNTENAIRFGYPIALFCILGISGFFGARVFWKVVEKNLLSPKPRIVQPGSKYGWIDRWKRSRAGYKTPEMILDPAVEIQLKEIQEKTKNIRDHIRSGRKVTYDNLLLYGKPGTGKTFFVQVLADYTDMDLLCVTAASLLQAGVEGIKYFDEILEMAEKSKYGVILFIDEADALFVNRDLLNPDSDHYKVLNHILATTGNGSNKIMIIAATNHAYVMDPAMGRRFQERIKLPLPSKETREKLLMYYLNEYLFDAAAVGFAQANKARALITPQRINEIVQETVGLSHAEIKDMVIIISKKASASAGGTLSQEHVQRAVSEAIEKKKALKKDAAKFKKKMENPTAAAAAA